MKLKFYPHINLKYFIIALVTLFSVSNSFAATFYSRANNGNWSASSSWSNVAIGGAAASTIPGINDDVYIAGGNTIILDISNPSCNSLTIGNGTSGTLLCDYNTTGTFTIATNLTLYANGAINHKTNSTSVAITLSVGGNIVNNGVIDISQSNKNRMNLVMTGANKTISGTGSTFNIFDFTVESGASIIQNYSSTNGFVVYNNMSVSGTFDLANGYSIKRSVVGGTLTVTGTLLVGGADNYPSNFTTNTLSGLVNFYYSGAQTVPSLTYTNLTYSGLGTKTTSSLTVNGILSMEGTAVAAGTISYSSSSTLQYKGSANTTTTSIELPSTFPGSGGIIFDQGVGRTVALHQNVSNAGILQVKSGTLNLNTYTLNRSSAGGSLTILDGAYLTIGGSNSLPSNYSTHSIACNSTITYNGTTQTVANLNSSQVYGNLVLNGTGTKTLQTGTTQICQDLTIRTSVAAVTGLTIGRDFKIESDGTFSAGSYTHYVNRDFLKSGTFVPETSTIVFNGNAAQSIASASFNNIQFTNAGIKTPTGNLSIAGNLTITSNFTHGAGLTHSLAGNFINNGSYTPGNGKITLNGSSAQSISGSVSTDFYDLEMNGSGLKSLAVNTQITNALTLTSGKLDISSYTLTTNSISGGGSTSYILTSGTGRVKTTISSSQTKVFPVGQSAYNPMSIKYLPASGYATFNVRLADGTLSNSNDVSKTVGRKWYVSKDESGVQNIEVSMTYNSGEQGVNFNSGSARIGEFSGEFWKYLTTVTVVSNTFTGTSSFGYLSENTSNYFYSIGSEDAFHASKYTVSSMTPSNPSLGLGTQLIVQSSNSQNVPVWTTNASGSSYSVTATNTTLSGTPTGQIDFNNYRDTLNSLLFTQQNSNGTAYLTLTNTAGEVLASNNSSTFYVYPGNIIEPMTSGGNWSTVQWRSSTNGGSTWTENVTKPTAAPESQVIRIPAGLTINADESVSFYNLEINGTLNLQSGVTLTLYHAANDMDVNITVKGDLVNNGGTINNTNTSYPLYFRGGNYTHNMSGGSIPLANWETDGSENAVCTVNGSNVGNLNQNFHCFVLTSGSNTLTADMTVNHMFTLTAGKITTSTNKVILGASVNVTANPGGYVSGNLRRNIPQNANLILFPVGDANYAAPITVDFEGFTGSPSGNGYLDVSTQAAQPPMNSGLSQTKYINRKWTVVNNGVSAYTSFNLEMTFDNGDKVGSPTLANLIVRKLSNSIWSNVTTTPPSSNTVQSTGMTIFSDFYIAEDDCSTDHAVWFGTNGTDWNTASNWCSGSVPGASTNAVIHSSTVNYPVIGTQGAVCNNLTIDNGASLTISNLSLLDINGDLSSQGTISSTSGSVLFSGSSQQSLTGTLSVKNLAVNNSAGVVVNNDITVTDSLNLITANPSDTQGALHMGNNTLTMGASAKNYGQGDVTGIINRNSFVVKHYYTFGNSRTTLYFPEVIGQTLPSTFTVKVSIGTAPSWKTTAVRRYYDVASTGGSGTQARVVYGYLQSEVPVGANETSLSVWSKIGSADPFEFGFNEYDETLNTIGVHGVNVANAPTSLGSFFLTLAQTATQYVTWNGEESDEWNNSYNWTPNMVPRDIVGAVIPDSTQTIFNPILPSNASAKYILLENKAVLSSQNGSSLTIYGSGNAWSSETGSVFYPSTSTVSFVNNQAMVQLSGAVSLYNLTIGTGVDFGLTASANVKIAGSFVNNGYADFSTRGNVVEFNGTNTQTITNPISTVESGYCDLILSGSGSKIFPASINLCGNLTTNSSVDAVTNSSTIVFKNDADLPQIQEVGGTVPLTLYNVQVENTKGLLLTNQLTIKNTLDLIASNPSDTTGLIQTGNFRLVLDINANIDGVGEVTGYIKRTQFNADTYYTMGHKNTKLIFSGSPTNFPDSVVVKVSIGRTPTWKTNAIKRVYDFKQNGGVNCVSSIRTHYLESELNGLIEGTLTQWTYGANGQQPAGVNDWGKSNQSIAENWIEIVNVDIANYPTQFGNLENTLASMSPPTNTWDGSESSDWDNPLNWAEQSIPNGDSKVVIPSAATTNYDPLLPDRDDIVVKLIYINFGGILNATTGTPTIRLLGGNEGAWTNNGTFNAGASTVVFDNSASVYGGTTAFYNITFTTNTEITFTDNSYLSIAGTAVNNGVGKTIGTVTIEYNGAGDQTIVNPDPSLDAYDNLVLSGGGTKTFPSSTPMTIYGNFTVSGSAVVNTSGDLTVYKNTVFGSGTTFNAGSYSHHLKGDFTNDGTFNASTGTVTFDGTASAQSIYGSNTLTFNNLTVNNTNGIILKRNVTVNGELNLQSNSLSLTRGAIHTEENELTLGGTTTGIGGVSGYARRNNLIAGTYSFGNPNNTITLNAGATAASVVLHLEQGVLPSWKTDAMQRKISLKATTASGTYGFRLHYRDTELNANTESVLSLWTKNATTVYETVPATRNSTDNYIDITNLGFDSIQSTFGTVEMTLGKTDVNTIVWDGSVSSDWTVADNWTPALVPSSTKDVIIPDASTTNNDPTLPANTEISTLLVESNGVLNGGTSTTLTINGPGSAVIFNGTFNQGTSKLILTNPNLELYSDINGYDIEIASGCTLVVKAVVTVRIYGNYNPIGIATSAYPFTFYYAGADQTIPVPNAVNKRYYNITLGGSGTKTFTSTPLTILGTFAVADNVTVNLGANINFKNALNVATGCTVNLGPYAHVFEGNINNNGTIVLASGSNSSIAGTFTNYGTITQNGGSFDFNGPFINYGTISSNGPGIAYLSSTFANHGTMSGVGSSEIVMDGTTMQTIDGTASTFINRLTIANMEGVQIVDTPAVNVDSLTINSGCHIEIPARKYLQVNTIINNAGVDGIHLKAAYSSPNASLVFGNSAGNPVSATVHLATKANYANNFNNWQYVGIPLTEFSKFNPILTGSYMRQFVESTADTLSSPWSPVDATLQAFKGYMLTQNDPRVIPFAGVLNNQSKTINLAYTSGAAYAGLNLVSNSFTAAVNISEMVFDANMDKEVYIFNTGYKTYTSSNSTSSNNSGQYVVVPQATAGTLGLPSQISSMQGFFVHATATGQTLQLPYASTEKQTVILRAPKLDSQLDIVGTRITVSAAHSRDNLWLFTHPSCTSGFDNGFDGQKFVSGYESANLFVSAADKDYQVYAVNDINNTSLNFIPGNSDTSYTLEVNHHNLLQKYTKGLYLLDLYEGKVINITNDSSVYHFTALPGSGMMTRFKVLTEDPTETEVNTQDAALRISSIEGRLVLVGSIQRDVLVEVYDLSGKVQFRENVVAGSSGVVSRVLNQGSYIVKVYSDNSTQVQKVLVR